MAHSAKKVKRKVFLRVRARQKLAFRFILVSGLCGVGLTLFVTTGFHFSGMNEASAKRPIEIRQMDEQVFTNEMSLPQPQIISGKTSEPNTIFIHRIKTNSSTPHNE